MKKLFILMTFISMVIVMVSSVTDIFFPVSVVGSVAEQVPKAGAIRLWYWLAGRMQPTDEFVQPQAGAYISSFNQQEVYDWLYQFMGEEIDQNLIWAN